MPQRGADRPLRRALPPAAADLGAEAALRAQALALAQQWLLGCPSTDPARRTGSLDPNLRASVLRLAAINGDAGLFNALRGALDRSSQRQKRQDLLAALAHIRNRALADQARALLPDLALDIRDVRRPLQNARNRDPLRRDGMLAFVQQPHGALVQRLGRDEPGQRPEAVQLACSRSDVDQIQAEFAPPASRFQGGQRALAQALASVRRCAAWRDQA